MSDEIWTRPEPQSPCVKICVMHRAEGICIGCFRTLDEIAGWGSMTRDERQALLDALPAREALLAQRRGGRRRRSGGDGG